MHDNDTPLPLPLPHVEQFWGVPLPKCKSERSRDGAFKLLNELAGGCESNVELVRGRGSWVGWVTDSKSMESKRKREEGMMKRFACRNFFGQPN